MRSSVKEEAMKSLSWADEKASGPASRCLCCAVMRSTAARYVAACPAVICHVATVK